MISRTFSSEIIPVLWSHTSGRRSRHAGACVSKVPGCKQTVRPGRSLHIGVSCERANLRSVRRAMCGGSGACDACSHDLQVAVAGMQVHASYVP